MLYNDTNMLPDSIKKILPVSGQKMYMDLVNAQFNKGNDEALASQVAWGVVKKRFNKVGDRWVANSSDFVKQELFEFQLEFANNELVVNDLDGELVIDAVLATTNTFMNPAGEPRHFEVEDLEELANQMNSLGSTNPTFSHNELQEVVKRHGFNYELVANELKQKRGILKSIEAAVKDGKLWIRAMLDKRYKNHVTKFKGLSLEALSTPIEGRLTKPQYLGFIFTDNPRDNQARVLA